MGRHVYIKNKKTKAGELGHWGEAKRIEAVTTYLTTGSNAETSRILQIPVKTINAWKLTDWWKELTEQIRSEETTQLDAKMSKVIDKALERIMDLVENGEHVYDQKTGKIKRMPAKLRDVNHAFNSILDKRQLIRKQPTKIVEQTNTAAQLQNLAEQFAKFTQQQVKELPDTHYIDEVTVVQNEEGVYELKE